MLGVRFIAINDNYDSFSGKSQSDEIVIPFKNLINDAYCRDISIKYGVIWISNEEKGNLLVLLLSMVIRKTNRIIIGLWWMIMLPAW